ncbi:hypothetical protein EDB84DRAFT_288294 [Lactarius hengduanensis]|nr:hypothetical protein EDB84DRAFT_288294 [Lactarius hengduanensis]
MPSSRSILRRSPHLGLVCPSYKPFWYDDGDLLLIVKDHVFRLRRATLFCSEVFRDMFTFAHPSPEESFEDCTVIHLTDEPEDWMLLLQCLDDSHDNFWEKDEPTYDMIASILRLATKYEVSEVRTRTVAKLHELWPLPASLETMDTRAFSPHRADAVALARQCDLPEILPAIFYSLAVDYTHTGGRVLPGRLSEPVDQRRLVVGAARLDAFFANALQRAQALGCCAGCRACIRERWSALLGGAWTLRAMYWQWTEVADEKAWDGLCMDCFCSYESFLEMTRTHLRDAIPGFFGL